MPLRGQFARSLQPVCGPAGRRAGDDRPAHLKLASTRLRSGWKTASSAPLTALFTLQPVCGPAGRRGPGRPRSSLRRFNPSAVRLEGSGRVYTRPGKRGFNPSAVRLEASLAIRAVAATSASTRLRSGWKRFVEVVADGRPGASTRLRSGWKRGSHGDASRRTRRFNPSAVRLEGESRLRGRRGRASTRLRSGWKKFKKIQTSMITSFNPSAVRLEVCPICGRERSFLRNSLKCFCRPPILGHPPGGRQN